MVENGNEVGNLGNADGGGGGGGRSTEERDGEAGGKACV